MPRVSSLGLLLLTSAVFAQSPIEPIAAFRQDARILFQGDSITDGNRGRNQDPNHIHGHGYVYLIAAKFGAAFPDRKLTFINRGISGHTAADLEKRWKQDTLDLKPDVLSVLIGVNDAGRGVPLDQYEATYDRLLAETRAANANVRLVLCEPFTLPVGGKKTNYEMWLKDIQGRQEITAKLAKKYDAALVRFQPVFEAACERASADVWIWDGVHPTTAGNQLMADEWVKTVREKWKD